MTTVTEIPLIPQSQGFTITLGDTVYRIRIQWREALAQIWNMDILDTSGNYLVAGVPLLPGADLLAQYPYLNIPGQLWVGVDSDPNSNPTYTNLGTGSHLYFITEP